MEKVTRSYTDAVERLREALAEPPSLLARDASIKRFELAYELAWKATQKHLGHLGTVCNSPRACLQEAFRMGLIADDAAWQQVLVDRNLCVHTYDEALAQAVYGRLPTHLAHLDALAKALVQPSEEQY